MANDIAIVRPSIDVSELPPSAIDHRATIWWGNLLMLAIETTMFVLLIAAYVYYRPNFQSWPPPQTNWSTARLNTAPALGLASLNLAILLASGALMAVADRAALRHRTNRVKWALVGVIVLAAAAIAVRFRGFSELNFRWDDNAYASTVWTLLGLHLLHLFVGTLENGIMVAWILVHGMDEKHARDVRVNAVYWYWIVAMWIVLFLVVYIGARVL